MMVGCLQKFIDRLYDMPGLTSCKFRLIHVTQSCAKSFVTCGDFYLFNADG